MRQLIWRSYATATVVSLLVASNFLLPWCTEDHFHTAQNQVSRNAIFERYGFARETVYEDAGKVFVASQQIVFETDCRSLRRLLKLLALLPDTTRVSHVRRLLEDEVRLTVETDIRCV